MRKYYKKIFVVLFFFAIIGNIAIFISSMKLSSEIHLFERKTFVLQQENTLFEKEMADSESFLHAKQYQQKWGFERATKAIYVGDMQIALNTKR